MRRRSAGFWRNESLSKDSEAYANRFAERIIEAAESLQTLPLRGRTVPEANSDSIRELLFGSFRIIYRVEPTRVLLMTVVHAARDLARMEPKPWEVF
jgi:plasmid stabilization system protein ParE